jgi:arylsulfatase
MATVALLAGGPSMGRIEAERAVVGAAALRQAPVSAKPNILFILADNLGYGELGAYGGGATRGAPTPRLDRLAPRACA